MRSAVMFTMTECSNSKLTDPAKKRKKKKKELFTSLHVHIHIQFFSIALKTSTGS